MGRKSQADFRPLQAEEMAGAKTEASVFLVVSQVSRESRVWCRKNGSGGAGGELRGEVRLSSCSEGYCSD